ncbi:MAG: lytic transglycosylase domain-containing protein [Thermoanaerobaculia bacterium]
MLLLGAALSVGGVTEALDQVQFLVQKDVDGVQVVRQSPEGSRVVAEVRDGIAANSVYKLAAIAPDSLVRRTSDLMQNVLFVDTILPESLLRAADPAPAEPEKEPVDFALLSQQVREEFFEGMPFGDLIREKSEKYDVDPALVAAIIEHESRFRPRARSHVGARGLMQLMPRTGAWMGARNLYDPEQNVDAGVRYLKYLEKRFKGNETKMIAAYNAGEGNVMRYGGIPPFRETRSYVKKVKRSYQKNARALEEMEREALAALE